MAGVPIEQLRGGFRGSVIEPSDAAYAEARKVYNGMIDRKPRVIAQCADVADVIAAVNFGRDNGLLTAIRGGGHNGGGLGICDDGLVVDLSRMKGRHVDAAARTIRVEGGCVWADVDHATHAFGMATPSGTIGTTGVAGLTLGGGIGHLTRKHGLTIDNLLSVDMVLADGSFVTASADANQDLYWAVRGGGGNFGVVTSFLFRLHPVKMVFAGPTFWPLEQTPEVMPAWAEFILKAPEDVTGFFAFLTVPPVPMFPANLHLQKMCGIIWCSTLGEKEADAATKPLRSVGKSAFEHVGLMPHPTLQTLFDALYPPGLQWYWRADFVKEISDKAVQEHLVQARKLPTPHSTVHLYPINGAAHKVASDATAFSYRDANWAEVIVGVDPDPKNADKITRWTKEYWEALHPYSAGGAYVNFMMDEGQERIRASFRGNYQRLAEVKKKYDPKNFFRVNQNIQPG
ncbi:MAG TPA: FAD-binding oxidoreductase [Steroidobacteraceae bacterium]